MTTAKKRLIWFIPIAMAALFSCAFFMYVGDYHHADFVAEEAMVSDSTVHIIQTEFGWFFDGESDKNALIFYPGGKVEACSYAPLCRKLAQTGIDVFLVEMPFNLAVFGENKADKIIGSMQYKHWFIAGHSLGGVMAASYASRHPDKLSGVILLASYSTKKLDNKLRTVLIYGSEDTVLNMEDYKKNLRNTPESTIEYMIEGGNHAQFGSYGVQSGDGTALISHNQQIAETVMVITESIL